MSKLLDIWPGMYRGHVTMRRDDPYARVTIPNHATLKKSTLRSIIRQAGLTVDEFVDLL